MCKDNVVDLDARVERESRGHLWRAMREGARQILHLALETETNLVVSCVISVTFGS